MAPKILPFRSHQRPRIRRFKSWHPELDRALTVMPEYECCPHDLYRKLAQHADGSTKDCAIVEDERGDPLGVLCLRKREALGDWVPLTHYIVPGLVFPLRNGSLAAVLSALDRNVRVVCWRMDDFNEDVVGLRAREYKPTFEIDLTGDYEKHWKKHSHLTEIKKQRERCKDFDVRMNGEGMAEWVIRKSEAKWREWPERPRPDLEDKVVAACYLEERQRSVTFTLHDRTIDQPVAGSTFIVHAESLVWQYTYREPHYEQFGMGTYIIDAAIKWALRSGIKAIDLGGDHPEHKKRWGPAKHNKISMHVCPNYLMLVNRGKEVVQNVRSYGMKRTMALVASKAAALLSLVVDFQ